MSARATLSVAPRIAEREPWLQTVRWESAEIRLIVESKDACAQRLGATPVERLRCVGSVEAGVALVAEHAGAAVLVHPLLLTGRVELLAYVREQSVSARYHRFGNLAAERLLPPLRAPATSS